MSETMRPAMAAVKAVEISRRSMVVLIFLEKRRLNGHGFECRKPR
jgi:hypothetical protein